MWWQRVRESEPLNKIFDWCSDFVSTVRKPVMWNIVCYFLRSAWSNVRSVIAQQMEGFKADARCLSHPQAQTKQMQDFLFVTSSAIMSVIYSHFWSWYLVSGNNPLPYTCSLKEVLQQYHRGIYSLTTSSLDTGASLYVSLFFPGGFSLVSAAFEVLQQNHRRRGLRVNLRRWRGRIWMEGCKDGGR